MTFEEEEKEAIAMAQRKAALMAARKDAPRAVKRILQQAVIHPKAIIVTGNKAPADTTGLGWKSWGQTQKRN